VPRYSPSTPSVRTIFERPSRNDIGWVSGGHAIKYTPHRPRYAEGESGRVVNILTLTSQKGLVKIAVAEPRRQLARKGRVESSEKGIANSLEQHKGDTLQATETS